MGLDETLSHAAGDKQKSEFGHLNVKYTNERHSPKAGWLSVTLPGMLISSKKLQRAAS